MGTNNHRKRLETIDAKVTKFYANDELIAEYWTWRNRHPINGHTSEDIDQWYSHMPHHLRPVWALLLKQALSKKKS